MDKLDSLSFGCSWLAIWIVINNQIDPLTRFFQVFLTISHFQKLYSERSELCEVVIKGFGSHKSLPMMAFHFAQ
jgi:hypothetical protein